MTAAFSLRSLFALALAGLMLAGCAGGAPDLRPDAPEFSEETERRYATYGSLFGEGGLSLFGGSDREEPTDGLGVNSFLWRASLDTVAFLPVTSADPFGGVILTDWHTPAATPNERFKLNVFILGRELRSDGVRVAVFRQVRDAGGNWTDAEVTPGMGNELEETILTRARELRVASLRG